MTKKAKSGRKNRSVTCKRVAGPDLSGVVAQEARPRLASWLGCTNSPHVLLNGALADPKAQFQQFTPDPFSPQSRFCVAICLIKAMVSAATFGLWEEVFDLRFQYRRKSSRC